MLQPKYALCFHYFTKTNSVLEGNWVVSFELTSVHKVMGD